MATEARDVESKSDREGKVGEGVWANTEVDSGKRAATVVVEKTSVVGAGEANGCSEVEGVIVIN